MKVRFATQLFSRSVAAALEICDKHLKLPQFTNCTQTIDFILKLNDLFDVFNSRNMTQFGYKQPLNSFNYEKIVHKLEECKIFLMNLQFKNRQKVISSINKTGCLGFVLCIGSLKGIYDELCVKTDILKYVPTYKASQDHLELFFGCIRAKGGWNNNPSTRSFKTAMKQMLAHSDIRDSGTGNCIPLEDITILHVTRNREQIINSSIPSELFDEEAQRWDKIANVIHDHSYIPDNRNISEFSSYIISYISGFVVKCLQKSLRCEDCINVLISYDEMVKSCTLIRVKSRGNLKTPSSSIIKICNEAEKIIRLALAESGGRVMKKKFTEIYLTTCVVRKFDESDNLFLDLTKYCNDQHLLEDHIAHLTKLIAPKYINIRLHYICKQSTDEISQRSFRNHLTHFEGR